MVGQEPQRGAVELANTLSGKESLRLQRPLLDEDSEKVVDDNDMDDIKKYKEKLQEKAMALATKVYENAAKERQQEESTEEKKDSKKDKKSKKSDDDVQEADIEEE